MIYIVDRKEGGFAICERGDGKYERVSLNALPGKVDDGDVFIKESGAFRRSDEETKRRRSRALSKLNNILKKNGDKNI